MDSGDRANADTPIPTGGDHQVPASRAITPTPTCTPTPETPPPPSHDPLKVEENTFNEEMDDDNFLEENENDLLSPEAQKLTSQILMSLSKTSLGSRTLSQGSLASENLLEDAHVCLKEDAKRCKDTPAADGEEDSVHEGGSSSSDENSRTTVVGGHDSFNC